MDIDKCLSEISNSELKRCKTKIKFRLQSVMEKKQSLLDAFTSIIQLRFDYPNLSFT